MKKKIIKYIKNNYNELEERVYKNKSDATITMIPIVIPKTTGYINIYYNKLFEMFYKIVYSIDGIQYRYYNIEVKHEYNL
jgi:hypothetical protein